MPQNNLTGSPVADLIPMLSVGIIVFALIACLASLPRIRESVSARLKEGQTYLYGDTTPTDEQTSEDEGLPSNREMEEFDRSIFHDPD